MSGGSFELSGQSSTDLVQDPNNPHSVGANVDDEVIVRQQRNQESIANTPSPIAKSCGSTTFVDDLILENDYFDSRCNFHLEGGGLYYRHHRTTSIHRNSDVGGSGSINRSRSQSLEDRRKWMSSGGNFRRRTTLDEHANNIVNRLEQDTLLMDNGAESEQLRREALRDLPQRLSLKRVIKRKFHASISHRSKHRPLGFFKRQKYLNSVRFSKIQTFIRSLSHSLELWYSSLKTIEGHFGSGVATYFKFLRWLFLMNCLLLIPTLAFIVAPQTIYSYLEPVKIPPDKPVKNTTARLLSKNTYHNYNGSKTAQVGEDGVSEDFCWHDIFSGEGYLTNTVFYYGFYTNGSVEVIQGHKYSIPHLYFFTMLFLYVSSFFYLSVSMARSYRRSFIETQGGLKNVYVHKIFCGWDFSVATEVAAELKSSAIYHELKEMLDDFESPAVEEPFVRKFWTFAIHASVNSFVLLQLFGVGYLIWHLLESELSGINFWTAVTISSVMHVFPVLYSFIVRYEYYENQKIAAKVTIGRIYALEAVIVGVLLTFWIKNAQKEQCWETHLGQEVYRLIVFDFIFSVICTVLIEMGRFVVFKFCWSKIGLPEFDIARHSLQLIYNQTLFWVGFYFSPLLGAVLIIKLWFMWYVRLLCLLKLCRPSTKTWRATQTHTWYLIASFTALLVVAFILGYIVVDVPTSDCGPFRNYTFTYEMIIRGVFQLEQNNQFLKMIIYVTKPGVVALILVGMCVAAYYLRARAYAQKGMVGILRNMLILEAKDKQFLLDAISRVTENNGPSH